MNVARSRPRMRRGPRWALLASALLALAIGGGPLGDFVRAQEQDGRGEWGEVTVLHSEETVRSTIDEVLSRSEFRRLRRDEARNDDLLEWLREFLEWLFPDAPDRSEGYSVGFVRVLLYVLVGLALAVVIGLVLRAVLSRTRASGAPGPGLGREAEAELLSTPPGERPADEYLRRSLELAAGGDYRGSVRELLLGCMSQIERQGLIRYRRGLTNRDYVRAVWRRVIARDALEVVVREFEHVFFGRRPATAQGFERCLEQYRAGFENAVAGEEGPDAFAS